MLVSPREENVCNIKEVRKELCDEKDGKHAVEDGKRRLEGRHDLAGLEDHAGNDKLADCRELLDLIRVCDLSGRGN